MALVSDNPLFACGIDDFSETQAVDEVRLLNYDINNFNYGYPIVWSASDLRVMS